MSIYIYIYIYISHVYIICHVLFIKWTVSFCRFQNQELCNFQLRLFIKHRRANYDGHFKLPRSTGGVRLWPLLPSRGFCR